MAANKADTLGKAPQTVPRRQRRLTGLISACEPGDVADRDREMVGAPLQVDAYMGTPAGVLDGVRKPFLDDAVGG